MKKKTMVANDMTLKITTERTTCTTPIPFMC